MSSTLIVLLCTAVTALLQFIARYVPYASRPCGILHLVWLAAALPVLYISMVSIQHVLLFYLLSALVSLLFSFGEGIK